LLLLFLLLSVLLPWVSCRTALDAIGVDDRSPLPSLLGFEYVRIVADSAFDEIPVHPFLLELLVASKVRGRKVQ